MLTRCQVGYRVILQERPGPACQASDSWITSHVSVRRRRQRVRRAAREPNNPA